MDPADSGHVSPDITHPFGFGSGNGTGTLLIIPVTTTLMEVICVFGLKTIVTVASCPFISAQNVGSAQGVISTLCMTESTEPQSVNCTFVE